MPKKSPSAVSVRKTSTTKKLEQLVREALEILQAFGVPLTALTPRRQEKMAKAVLAVAGLKPGDSWDAVRDNASGHRLSTRQVIRHMNAHLGEDIADSSYDDIRRKDLILPVAALVVIKSSANPDANTNDGTRAYAIEPLAAAAMREFGTINWNAASAKFLGDRPTLSEQLLRERHLARVSVKLREGVTLSFSAGAHNQLQKQIIDSFLPIYGFGAEVLYVGDGEKKYLHLEKDKLLSLKFFEIAHDKLPDVLAYSADKNWLFLIEAVTTANPIDEMRRLTLAKLCETCTANIVYVTAFQNRDVYRKFASDIAWETEVWIADAPEHLIHFNGDKFLGPYKEVG